MREQGTCVTLLVVQVFLHQNLSRETSCHQGNMMKWAIVNHLNDGIAICSHVLCYNYYEMKGWYLTEYSLG